MNIKHFIPEEGQKRIVEAIAALEKRSNAEVRVHIDSRSGKSPVEDAKKAFDRLKMFDTAERSGVLIYVALKSHTCAIIGDEGIDGKVDPSFWSECCDAMISEFVKGRYTEGILKALDMAGKKLAEYFPKTEDNTDELPNDISFGK